MKDETEIPVDPARTERVKRLLKRIQSDLDYWEPDFKRMKENRRFARGLQWPGMSRKDLADMNRPYVENVTLRHLKQRTAATYARNPKFKWYRTQRLYHVLWDGSKEMLMQAIAMTQPPQPAAPPTATSADPAAAPAAAPVDPNWQPDPNALAIIQEASDYAVQQNLYRKMGETVAFMYEWSLKEQTQVTKRMMKRTVLQAGTCGVGYVKQTFQRLMQMPPDAERAIHDAKSQLATIQRLSEELQEGELEPDDPEVDRLKTLIAELEASPQILLREGLALDYPDPLNIIPDQNLEYLPGFVGCEYVTEMYHLTPEKVREVYGVDLGKKFTPYYPEDGSTENRASYIKRANGDLEDACVRVFEMYHRGDGLIYTMAEGYDDYLIDPAAPDPWTERFWPWFVYAPNAIDDPENPMPPSDVELIQPMQAEINRAGEGLRDHRYAARPGHVIAGMLSTEDADRMRGRAAHAVLALQGLPPDGDVRKWLQAFPTNPIDPNLYETGSAMQGMLRATGTQEANLGPTSGATATESSIAQSSRQSTDDSAIDELDDLLTEMAAAGAQILFLNMTPETVKQIAGPGAMWPVADKETVAKEIYLEVEAGSSGRKNQAQEIQMATQLLPFVFQLPGIDPEAILKWILSIADSRLNLEDMQKPDALSIIAMNGVAQASANATGGPAGPAAQGPAGSSNAPTPQPGGQQGPQPPGPPVTA